MKIEKPKYPGIIRVHWPGQPVDCCLFHATKLEGVAKAMGFMVSKTEVPEDEVVECMNCLTEQYKSS